MVHPVNQNVQVGMVLVRPELPPELAWQRLFENMFPSLLSKELPLLVSFPPFMIAKQSWNTAFDIDMQFKFPSLDDVVEVQRHIISTKSRSVARTLVFDPVVSEVSEPPVFSASPVTVQKKRVRKNKVLMTHNYRGSQQSSREVKPKFIDSTQGEPKNIYKP
jgi:hypothetical protein